MDKDQNYNIHNYYKIFKNYAKIFVKKFFTKLFRF